MGTIKKSPLQETHPRTELLMRSHFKLTSHYKDNSARTHTHVILFSVCLKITLEIGITDYKYSHLLIFVKS